MARSHAKALVPDRQAALGSQARINGRGEDVYLAQGYVCARKRWAAQAALEHLRGNERLVGLTLHRVASIDKVPDKYLAVML